MAGMGPPPKPSGTRARRNAAPQTTRLPEKGRGNRKAPAWPLRPDRVLLSMQSAAELAAERARGRLNECADRRSASRLERELDRALAEASVIESQLVEQAQLESQLWAELWATPQATMWEQNGWLREVALYVRLQLQAEAGDLKAAAEARQRSDRLGLNPQAMLRLRWEIERTDEAEDRGTQRRQRRAPAASGAKGRPDPRATLHAVS